MTSSNRRHFIRSATHAAGLTAVVGGGIALASPPASATVVPTTTPHKWPTKRIFNRAGEYIEIEDRPIIKVHGDGSDEHEVHYPFGESITLACYELSENKVIQASSDLLDRLINRAQYEKAKSVHYFFRTIPAENGGKSLFIRGRLEF